MEKKHKNAAEGSVEELAEESPETVKAEEPVEAPNAGAELEQAIADAEEYKRKWYAVTAEYENYRRRTANQSAQRYLEGRADVITGILPIADNLERALQSCTDEGTRKGIEMVMKSFDKLLETEKITVIDPVSQPFDAEKHEAIMAVDAQEGEESGTVKQVYLKGYEREGKVLRFAQVIVIK